MLEKLFTRLEEIFPELVEFRRDLHMYPELSFQEVNTPRKIAEFLEGLGLEVKTGVGGRGVVGKLVGGNPGRTIALRADFDALPIQDEKDVEYKSRIPGVMHACGHDIHTSSLLGVARLLSEVREELPGTVLFIHQFAEEQIPGGAISMIEDGCLEGVEAIYGIHVWSSLPVGTVGIIKDYAMAAGDKFDIEVIGKGGHGAKPQVTVDSLLVGSQLVGQLHHIVSRRVDPQKPAVLTVGTFNSGQAFNVISERAYISGTVRTFDEEVRDLMEGSIEQVSRATCEAAGAEVVVKYERGYPSLYNHPEHIDRAEQVAIGVVGQENVRYPSPSMGMEDFAYYVQRVPGAFIFVGGGNPEIAAEYPQHHPKFNADERSIIVSSKMFLSLLLEDRVGQDLKEELSDEVKRYN